MKGTIPPLGRGLCEGTAKLSVDVHVGDKLVMRKPHPCGARELLVLRTGMDFRLRCAGCGREFMIPRLKIEKHIKQILHGDGE